MEFVASTPVIFGLIAFLMLKGPYRGLLPFAIMLPFGMMAAINLPTVGGMSLLAIDVAFFVMLMLVLLRRDVGKDIMTLMAPGSMALTLLLLLGYAVLSALFFPRIFAGATEVFSLSRSANENGISMVPLKPTNSNLSQLFRMCLQLGTFMIVAILIYRRPNADYLLKVIKWVTGVHVSLGVIDILTNGAGIAWILEPIRTANYALTLGQEMAGIRRMIGGFPEASSFGYFSLGLFGFWLSYFLSARSANDRSADICLALSAFVLLRSTSSSAYVGAAAFIFIFALLQFRKTSIRGPVLSILLVLAGLVPLLIASTYVSYALVPAVESYVDRSLLNKLESNSGIERMTWNIQALKNLTDTYFIGAGLGSLRASNWVAVTLGTLGLPGLLIYLAFFWRLFTASPTIGDVRTQHIVFALQMGCLAMLMRSLVVHATPNMSMLFFLMAGSVAGLCALKVPVTHGVLPIFRSRRTI